MSVCLILASVFAHHHIYNFLSVDVIKCISPCPQSFYVTLNQSQAFLIQTTQLYGGIHMWQLNLFLYCQEKSLKWRDVTPWDQAVLLFCFLNNNLLFIKSVLHFPRKSKIYRAKTSKKMFIQFIRSNQKEFEKCCNKSC